MQSYLRFSVYNHTLIIKDNHLITRKFIVLKSTDGYLQFTDFHKYIKSFNRSLRNITDDGNNRYDFVVKLLNYGYFHRNIQTLDGLTVEIVKDFLNAYGSGTLPGDEQGRTKGTVEACVSAIIDFLDMFIKGRKTRCSMTREDLYKMVPVRNKMGRTVYKKIPVFEVVFTNKPKEIFRDIPNSAFEILFAHIAEHHSNLLMLISLSAFAGLRPSEAVNVRREDSALGPGLIFTIYDGEVQRIQIDLRKELCLRSDLKSSGKIKKERLQTVPFIFTEALANSYNRYMEYIKGQKYESNYGALTVNKQGRALTYDSYYQEFRNIIKKEIIPIFLKNEDPEIVNYGRLLLENNLAPHVFRHWYTVQLVLSGVDNVAELMQARGDTSPESAFTYLQNKGELEKQYRKVNNEMFGFLSWVAEKKRKENE